MFAVPLYWAPYATFSWPQQENKGEKNASRCTSVYVHVHDAAWCQGNSSSARLCKMLPISMEQVQCRWNWDRRVMQAPYIHAAITDHPRNQPTSLSLVQWDKLQQFCQFRCRGQRTFGQLWRQYIVKLTRSPQGESPQFRAKVLSLLLQILVCVS